MDKNYITYYREKIKKYDQFGRVHYEIKNHIDDIPEDYILNLEDIIDDLPGKQPRGYGVYFDYQLKVKPSQASLVKSKILFSTFLHLDNPKCVFVRYDNDVFPVYLDKRKILPIRKLTLKGWIETSYLYGGWTSKKVKLFFNEKDWEEDQDKKIKKKEERSKTSELEDLRKHNQPFALSSPKLKVIDVVKPTVKLVANVGDVIQGKLKVIENKYGILEGCLRGYDGTNWIDVYVNDKLVNDAMSLRDFQRLFIDNYKVDQI